MKRNFRGLKKYESLLKTICMIPDLEDYYYLNEDEWEGCLGVACVISVIEGVTPNMFHLSKHLDIPFYKNLDSDYYEYNYNLQNAFERLRKNYVFSKSYNVANDPLLNGNGRDIQWRTAAELTMGAWCIIAGVASGKTGL